MVALQSLTDASTSIRHKVYLQIEQGPLCFKIEVDGAEADRSALRDRWHKRLTATAVEMGGHVARPARMRSGTCMTVGRIE